MSSDVEENWGEDEIALHNVQPLWILPLYSVLPSKQQAKVVLFLKLSQQVWLEDYSRYLTIISYSFYLFITLSGSKELILFLGI